MEVRLLIVPHPLNIYQACVMDTKQARGWIKTFESKLDCLTELLSIDLLASNEVDEIIESDFDVMDRILIIKTEADPETLEEAGFDVRTPPVRN